MSRRSAASLLTLALLVALAVVALRQPVPWVLFSPGPTVNVLGEYEGKPIVDVEGRPSYRDDGGLRLVTVVPGGGPGNRLNLLSAITGWVDPDVAVLPYDSVYQPDETQSSIRQEGQQQMVSSQDNAIAAALRALDIDFETAVGVRSVAEGGASDGKLEVGDVVRRVDGRAVSTTASLIAAVSSQQPGSVLSLEVGRDGRTEQVRVTTRPATDDKSKSRINVEIAPTYDFPFDIDLNLNKNIGGPSAGMLFALGIYDVLTKGSMTDGRTIAGSGEIDPEGNVLPIGGIAQKLAGAERDGVELFLVAADNCAEAERAEFDREQIRLVKVTTLDDAIEGIEAWAADPKAELEGCA